jgi:thiol-disulfide isomerase/thioredoxin
MRANSRRQPWILLVLAAWVAPAWAQDKKKEDDPASLPPVMKVFRGRVVDEAGKPMAGVGLATYWFREEDQPDRAVSNIAKTDDQGQFRVEVTFYYGRPETLCALDLGRKRGGLMAVGPKTPDEPITIQAGPLVHLRGKYVCNELGTPVGWTNTMFTPAPGNGRVYSHMTKKGEFSVLLPPGRYQIRGYGGPDVGQHRRDLTLTADKLDVDLGDIDLAASELAKLKGKPAPSLHPTDARGVSKGIRIADYKGKWVALEFWGHWCGPCVARALPRMMEIHDDHSGERDKYVVLTVHSQLGGKNFAEVDEKLVPVVRDVWGGRMIPFPILLDAEGEIQRTFGVSHWPTTILFDPEGKVVGEIQPDELGAKLDPVPPAVALPRQLDRNTIVYFADGSLKQALANLKLRTRADYELDREALASLARGEETKIPLTLAGQVSLRSALDLLLDPVDLSAKFGPKGYIITRKSSSDPSAVVQPSDFQTRCAARIERKLKESKSTYQFDRQPLEKVAAFFESQSDENVVLDPKGRMRGKIDPATPVTGSGKDVPMGEALEKLLSPLGLRPVVRDEVIIIEVGGARPAAAAALR